MVGVKTGYVGAANIESPVVQSCYLLKHRTSSFRTAGAKKPFSDNHNLLGFPFDLCCE